MVQVRKAQFHRYMRHFPPETMFRTELEYTSGTWWTETYYVENETEPTIRVVRDGLGCKVYIRPVCQNDTL